LQSKDFKIALLQSSTKLFEKRVPLHPKYFNCVDLNLRKFVYFEQNYSTNFGYPDYYHEQMGYKTGERANLIASADCTMLVRPMPHDIISMKENSISLGWFHCVQDKEIVDAAIKKQITLISMENLYDKQKYFFEENSRISGKAAIIYALKNTTVGLEQNPLCVVIGHGNAGIAAIETLKGLGVKNIICCTKRSQNDIKNRISGIIYKQIKQNKYEKKLYFEENRPILELLKHARIIINATTQNIYQPAIFLYKNDLKYLQKDTLIIDISCDRQMGFEFATITPLNKPIIRVENILYFAVDHLPTLDYDYASKAISSKIITLIPDIINYLKYSKLSPIIEKAIQIRRGVIVNPDINYFQKRPLI
jgi:alanine dehydrogenase